MFVASIRSVLRRQGADATACQLRVWFYRSAAASYRVWSLWCVGMRDAVVPGFTEANAY